MKSIKDVMMDTSEETLEKIRKLCGELIWDYMQAISVYIKENKSANAMVCAADESFEMYQAMFEAGLLKALGAPYEKLPGVKFDKKTEGDAADIIKNILRSHGVYDYAVLHRPVVFFTARKLMEAILENSKKQLFIFRYRPDR